MTFNIIDHLDQMVIKKETVSRYRVQCPCCHDGTVVISRQSGSKAGAYFCTNQCTPASIRESLGVKNYNSKQREYQLPKKTLKYTPVKGGKFYHYKKLPKTCIKSKNDTYYLYSPQFRVHRIDRSNGKICLPYYLVGKSFKRIDEAELSSESIISHSCFYYLPSNIEAIANKIVLMVEGEKCCNTIMEKMGIACITPPGHGWNKKWLKHHLIRLPVKGIIMIPDHDQPGKHKKEMVQNICAELYMPFSAFYFPDLLTETIDVADLNDHDFQRIKERLSLWN